MAVWWDSHDGSGCARSAGGVGRQTALQMAALELASEATFFQEIAVILQIMTVWFRIMNDSEDSNITLHFKNVVISYFLHAGTYSIASFTDKN